MPTVAESLVQTLAEHGVAQMWGVVGDALNPVTDAIRRTDDLEWIGVRHEEAGAFAASAQAQLTGRLAVCMGTVGPGSIHLLNGLYDAKKSHAPVLAICGQVPSEEIGSDFFQEVDNDKLFADVSVFCRTVTSASQFPHLLEQAVNAAYAGPGVAVLTLPGDIGGLDLPKGTPPPVFAPVPGLAGAPVEQIETAAAVLNDADAVTLLVGCGARPARAEVLELADTLGAPMVLSLKAKEELERDNPYEIGQSGLIGNPATAKAFDDCDVLFMVGTDFPYRDWLPTGKTVIQLDLRQTHIGRRTAVQHPVVGDARLSLRELLPRLNRREDRTHLERAVEAYQDWRAGQQKLDRPVVREGPGRQGARHLRQPRRPDPARGRGPGHRPAGPRRHDLHLRHRHVDGVAEPVRDHAGHPSPDRVLQPGLDGQRHAPGPRRAGAGPVPSVIAFCGDGGLMMLLGDLRTAVTYGLPVTFVVFDNGRLGMVKLEQEQGGLPEFGTELDNPDLAATASALGLATRRVTESDALEDAVGWALAQDGPTLLDIVTNPDEVSLPPKTKPGQAWGFAIAKLKETL